MEGYFSSKLKRKDLENVDDDFSEFSLSSPARKIRRLDAELLPIIEEEECEIPSVFDHSVLEEKRLGCNFSGGIKIEELPNEFSNEERAIVLFNPIKNTPLVHSPSSFSLSMSPDLLSELKRNHHPLWPSQSDSCKLDDESLESSDSGSSNGCRAVVPWFPSNHSASASVSASAADLPSQIINIEMMEEEEDAMESRMDVEDSTNTMEQMNVNESGGMSLSEGFNQWQQQQHCVFPLPPQNAATPIVWYR